MNSSDFRLYYRSIYEKLHEILITTDSLLKGIAETPHISPYYYGQLDILA